MRERVRLRSDLYQWHHMRGHLLLAFGYAAKRHDLFCTLMWRFSFSTQSGTQFLVAFLSLLVTTLLQEALSQGTETVVILSGSGKVFWVKREVGVLRRVVSDPCKRLEPRIA